MCDIKRKKKKNKFIENEIGFVVTEAGVVEGWLDEDDQKVQTTTYKTNKY